MKSGFEWCRKFFDVIEFKTGQEGATIYCDEKIYLPNSKRFEWAPDFFVDHTASQLELALDRYMKIVKRHNVNFTNAKLVPNVEEFFLYALVRDMANSDYSDLHTYVNRRADFLEDSTFSEFDKETHLSNLNNFQLSVKRVHEYHGLETPFSLEFYFRKHSKPYALPKVRYGIFKDENGEKTACVYCVQKGSKPKRKFAFEDELGKMLNQVNTGMTCYRNCDPKKVIALTLFLKMAHDAGIRKVIAPDYIPARYALRYGDDGKKIVGDDILEQIQTRVTNDFLRLFARMEEQIEGMNITSTLYIIDSFIHFEMDEKISTKNKLLNVLAGISELETESQH